MTLLVGLHGANIPFASGGPQFTLENVVPPWRAVDLIAAEIRMVEYVEEIHAELHSDAFRQLEVLVDRQVRIQEARTTTIASRLHVRMNGADLIADEREGIRIEDLITLRDAATLSRAQSMDVACFVDWRC